MVSGEPAVKGFVHAVEVPVTWGDVDPAKIVFHPRYFHWIDYACQQWLKAVGRAPLRLAEEENIHLLIVEAHASFRRPSYYDDILRLEVSPGEVSRKVFTLEVKIFRNGSELVAEGYQKRAYVRYHPDGSKHAEPIPPDFFAGVPTA